MNKKGIDISSLNVTKEGTVKTKDGEGDGIWNGLFNKEISFGGNGFDDKKRESFYHELSILIAAGVDIRTSFELIASEQKKERDKVLIENILNSIVNGSTFSDALTKEKCFTMYECVSIQIGEETGKLVIVLDQLAAYFKGKISQKRQIISSMTYPGIVLCVSVGAIFFMLNFVVPMFSDIFKRFGGKLPPITKFIINAAAVVHDYGLIFLLVVAGLIWFIARQRHQELFRKYASHIVLKVPFVGELIRKIYLIRFCTSMTLLISAKVPILRAIQLIRKMINYYPIEESLDQIEKDVLIGIPLHESLSKFSIYPKKMIYLIKVGEEVNQLDHFFEKTGAQYDEEVKYLTSIMGSLVEPFMIVFLGLVVGFILIAMYLPLFQLSSSF
ncbi:MAG TPA: type II secretion system F family protein [Cytophagaceae bacterium]|jgi:type IV pilus assembly protein PilC|nr:type II secretion system F family protein [Cytophagaceae bacterium]